MSTTDHAARIKDTTDSIRLHVVAYPDCGGNLVPSHLDDIDTHTDALQRERNEAVEAVVEKRDVIEALENRIDELITIEVRAKRELAAERARSKRYRTALEAEFAYNMLAIIQQYANPKVVTEAAEIALEAWQDLRHHGDPVGEWPGYQPGNLPDESEAS